MSSKLKQQESGRLIAAMLLEDEQLKFTSDISGITLDFDKYSGAEAHGTIEWTLHLDVRDWGIKDFTPAVTAMDFYILYEDYDAPHRGEEDVERMIQIQYPLKATPPEGSPKDMLMSTPSKRDAWSVETQFDSGSPGLDSGMRPRFLEVNSKRRRVTVMF